MTFLATSATSRRESPPSNSWPKTPVTAATKTPPPPLHPPPSPETGGLSAYALGHIIEGGAPNVPPRYHAIHIRLLNALNSVAPHPELAFWRDKWRSQVDEY